MNDLERAILEDLEWRQAASEKTLADLARSLGRGGPQGNILELLLAVGVSVGDALAAASTASGLPLAPPARLAAPDFEGWDLQKLRALQVVPLGTRAGRRCLAYADPQVAARRNALGLAPHDAFLASPLEVRRILGEGSAEVTRTALSAPPPRRRRRREAIDVAGALDAPPVGAAEDFALQPPTDPVRKANARDADSFLPTTEAPRLDHIHSAMTEAPRSAAPRASLRLPAVSLDPLIEETIDAGREFAGDTVLLPEGPPSTVEQRPLGPVEVASDDVAPAVDLMPRRFRSARNPSPVLQDPGHRDDEFALDTEMVPARGSPVATRLDGSSPLTSAPSLADDDPLFGPTLDVGPLRGPPRPVSGLGSSAPAPDGRSPEDDVGEGLDEVIGRGPITTAYRVRQDDIADVHVVKRLALHLASERSVVERFRSAATTSMGLHHPGVLPVLRYGEADDVPYVVVAHAEEGSLYELMGRMGRVPAAIAASLLAQALAALAYAHQAGVVHGGLHAKNLLFSQGRLLLADFGFGAPGAHANLSVSVDGGARGALYLGTPAYSAPELLRGGGPPAPSADLFSLGVVFFEAIAGKHPFGVAPAAELARRIEMEPAPFLLEVEPTVPLVLDRVMAGLLANAPADRYASAAAALHDVEELVALCDPDGRLVPEALRDPVAAARRLSRLQAEAEVAHAEVAASAHPPRMAEAGFRLLRATALCPHDRDLAQRRNGFFGDHRLQVPSDMPSELERLRAEVPRGVANAVRDEGAAHLDDGELLAAMVRLRQHLRRVPIDPLALGRLQEVVGHDKLAPFSVPARRHGGADEEPSFARRHRILNRPKF